MDITKRHGSKEQHGYMNVVMQEVTVQSDGETRKD